MSTLSMAADHRADVRPPGTEFVLTSTDFQAIAAMLRHDAGIALPEFKTALVYARLAKRLRALGLGSFADYCALVAGPSGTDERRHMMTALTTNLTSFFREAHHFEHLKTQVLPSLLDNARRGGRVRLWSAACSTGQEAYSLALTILSLAPDAARLDIRVLGTDIDTAVLAEAQAGVYADAEFGTVPPDLRARWFQRVRDASGGWRVTDDLRRLVSFRQLNLAGGGWPMKGRFHAILCRNVVIYFDDTIQAAVWRRLTPLVEPGGHLYIGHSERLIGPAARAFENVGITTYCLLGGEA